MTAFLLKIFDARFAVYNLMAHPDDGLYVTAFQVMAFIHLPAEFQFLGYKPFGFVSVRENNTVHSSDTMEQICDISLRFVHTA